MAFDIDAADANARANWISGNVVLKSGYTAARAAYLDNINHGLPGADYYTSTRAGYLDRIANDDIFPIANILSLCSSISTGGITYTVGAGSTVLVYSYSSMNGTLTINGVSYPGTTWTTLGAGGESYWSHAFNPPLVVTAGNSIAMSNNVSLVGVVYA